MRTLLFTTCLSFSLAATGAAFAGKADDTLNAAFDTEIATLDNFKETGRPGLILARQLYDCLLEKDITSGEFKPAIASSYTVVDDRTLEFKIRDDVKFHDGSELTVDDVVYTYNLVAGGQYVRYAILTNWIDRAEKVDERTVRVLMKKPTPTALEFVAGNIPIYSKAYHEKAGPQGMATAPVGTGPYRLVKITPGVSYSLERFDDYYAGGLKVRPAIKHLVVRILPEQNTQYAEMMSGQLDWIWRVPASEAKRMTRFPNIEVSNVELLRTTFIQVNVGFQEGKSPFSDVRVRKALNMAIDRNKIVKSLVQGGARPIDSPCNPVQFGCEPIEQSYPFDVEGARKLIAEAGYANGFTAELLVTNTPLDQAQAIAEDLRKIGITLNINKQQSASGVTLWRGGNVPVRLYDWGSYGVADVGLTIPPFFGGGEDDRVKDPNLMADIARAEQTMDREQRKLIYANVLRRISEEAYAAPLWTNGYTMVTNKDLEIRPGYDEFVPFSQAKWR